MRKITKIILVAMIAILTFSCQKESKPAKDVEGDFTIDNITSLSINGAIPTSIATDYANAEVIITSTSNTDITVTLKNVALGLTEVNVPCTAGTKATGFEGSTDTQGRTIGVSGSVENGKLTLNLTDTRTSDIVGKWMVAPMEVTIPQVGKIQVPSFYFKTDAPELQQVIALVNSLLPLITAPASQQVDYLEYAQDGLMKIGYEDNHAGLPAEERFVKNLMDKEVVNGMTIGYLVNNLLQFYEEPDKGLVHLYVQPSIITVANAALAQAYKDGTLPMEIVLPIPFDIPGQYRLSSGNLNLYINQTLVQAFINSTPIIKQYLEAAMALLPTLSMQDAVMALCELLDMQPEEVATIFAMIEITDEASYEAFKAQVLGFAQLLVSGTYEMGVNLIPYTAGPRPWDTTL